MLAVDATALSRSFGSKKILDRLSLQVEPGELLAICGENGSGKTTLLRMLATLITPNSGDAKIFGHSVTENARQVRQQLAWCPASDAGFLPRLTGKENLIFFSNLRGIGPRLLEERLAKHKDLGPLGKALDTPFYLCSAGMKQSLALARALVAEPRLLLLDEPMRGLDPRARAHLLDYLEEVSQSSTVILTSHQISELEHSNARVVRIGGGSITC